MALSDILMCLTALPITPLYAFNGFWMFGETLCKLLPAFQVLSVLVSGLSLAGIALDRYKAVSITKSKSILSTSLVIAGIDLFAVMMAIPYTMNIKVRIHYIKVFSFNVHFSL